LKQQKLQDRKKNDSIFPPGVAFPLYWSDLPKIEDQPLPHKLTQPETVELEKVE